MAPTCLVHRLVELNRCGEGARRQEMLHPFRSTAQPLFQDKSFPSPLGQNFLLDQPVSLGTPAAALSPPAPQSGLCVCAYAHGRTDHRVADVYTTQQAICQ